MFYIFCYILISIINIYKHYFLQVLRLCINSTILHKCFCNLLFLSMVCAAISFLPTVTHPDNQTVVCLSSTPAREPQSVRQRTLPHTCPRCNFSLFRAQLRDFPLSALAKVGTHTHCFISSIVLTTKDTLSLTHLAISCHSPPQVSWEQGLHHLPTTYAPTTPKTVPDM